MAKRDFYEVLGVNRNASEADVKKAYRRLAMKHHPDRNSGDKTSETQFKEAKEAYEILSDQHKRAAYDQFGHAGVDSSAAAGARGGFHAGAGGANFSDIFGDVFGDIFGGSGRGGRQTNRGTDLRYTLDLDLEQAVRGAEVRIRVPTLSRCETCKGSGAKSGTQPTTCPTCAGHGQVRMQQGFFSIQQTCPNCRGSGKVVKDPCPECHGAGRMRHAKTLSVKVPAGVDEGDQIRLAGEGEAGDAGAPPGDLYVQVRLKAHAIFKRDGDDLHCEMPVSVAKATLGGEVEVPTLENMARLTIPPGTQSDKIFRLRGKGVTNVRSGNVGDLYCHATIETPVNLTRKQRELLEEFDRLVSEGGAKHSPRGESWVERVKSFFG